MLVVTDAQFKSNPQAYLDRVDEGEEVLLERSEGQRYLIIPAQDEPSDQEDYFLEPDEDLERAISLDELQAMLRRDIHEMFRTPPLCRQ